MMRSGWVGGGSESSIIVFVFLLLISGCRSDDPVPVNCDLSDLSIDIASFVNPTNCTSPDGSITVEATGGKEPYEFKVEDATFGTSMTFGGLSTGEVTLAVRDANGCVRSVTTVLGDLQADVVSTSSGCQDHNATLTVSPTGGQGPYQFNLDGGSFRDDSVFTALGAGKHTVGLRDQGGCEVAISAKVTTGVSYADDIQPILTTFCIKSGCHNGDNGNQRNWNSFQEVQGHADMIEGFTANRSMPPAGEPQLSDDQINRIACWVDDGAPNN